MNGLARRAFDTTPRRRARPAVLACAAALALGGCASAAGTPERLELANMNPGNVVPKSSPAQLVAAFERFCLDTDAAAAPAALRRSDYVEVPRRTGGMVRSFVVDDRRPAVMLSDAGRACAVAAASRTGQTERLRGMITRRFPGATPVDPARIGAQTEQAWVVPGARGGIVFVQRLTAPAQPSRLILGIQRNS